jgi:hypothetical protein
MFGWILVVIGIIFAILGIGGSAKLESDSFGGIAITAGGGIILIIVGVLFWAYGI